MKISRIWLLAGLACSLMGFNARAELVNGIKALVADSVITYQQVELLVARDAEFIRVQYGNRPDEYKKRIIALMNDGLDNLIKKQLVLQEFKNSGFNIPEAIIDEYVQDRVKEKYADRVQLTKQLQKEGITFEQFRKGVRDDMIFWEMSRKFIPEPIISPYKIEAFYQAHQEEFKVQDQIKTRIIVLNNSPDDSESASRRGAEILSQLKNGASFAQMASVYSEGPTRNQGGEIGWQETSVVLKPIAEAVSKIKPGEYTDLIVTSNTCFIVLLEDRRPAHVKPISEVRDDIERTLKAQENARMSKKWFDRLKNKTFVRIF